MFAARSYLASRSPCRCEVGLWLACCLTALAGLAQEPTYLSMTTAGVCCAIVRGLPLRAHGTAKELMGKQRAGDTCCSSQVAGESGGVGLRCLARSCVASVVMMRLWWLEVGSPAMLAANSYRRVLCSAPTSFAGGVG